MKGMLIKDFCILKLQKNAVLVLLAMCVGIHSFHEKSYLYCQSVSDVWLSSCIGNTYI